MSSVHNCSSALVWLNNKPYRNIFDLNKQFTETEKDRQCAIIAFALRCVFVLFATANILHTISVTDTWMNRCGS